METVSINRDAIIAKISKTLVTAGSTFRPDQIEAYRSAIEKETESRAKWVLSQLLENALTAETHCSPLCDDTGIPHIFLEIGRDQIISAELFECIQLGIKQGLDRLPGRPMAVRGNEIERLEQSQGLFEEPSALEPAPICLRIVPESIIRVTILMLGGGPAIRGITHRIFHKHSHQIIIDEIVDRAKQAVSKLGCSPCTLAIGIGRSQFEATSLMIEAMAKGNYSEQSEFEKEITRQVNNAHIGPLCLGGSSSVLATFAKIGPQRASGVRIVALRPCCCFEPRRASVVL